VPPPAVVVVCAEMLIVRSSITEMLESETDKVRKVFIEVVITCSMIHKNQRDRKAF